MIRFHEQIVVNDKVYWMFPKVIKPTVESAQFIQYMKFEPHESVLEVGTGCGILAIVAAETAASVIATDIAEAAVENARYNVSQYNLEDKIEVRLGSFFEPIKDDEKFDAILFNVGNPAAENELFFWHWHEGFLSQAAKYLKPGGRAYVHGGFLKNIPRTQSFAAQHGLKIIEMHMWTTNKESSEPILFVFGLK